MPTNSRARVLNRAWSIDMGGLGATIIPASPATVEGTSHLGNPRYCLIFRDRHCCVTRQEAEAAPASALQARR